MSYMNVDNQDANNDAAFLFDNFCEVLDVTEEQKDEYQGEKKVTFENCFTVARIPYALEYLNNELYQPEKYTFFGA